MAKFKVGDRVVFKDEGWRGRVVGIGSDGTYVVQFDGVGDHAQGADYFREDQLARNAVFSTNPVVQNALNRMACNGSDYRGTFKVGQVVVMKPEAVRGMGYSGKIYSTVTKVFDGGKSAIAFDGLEITGREAGPITWYDPEEVGTMVKRGKIPYEVASRYFSDSALNSAACNAADTDKVKVVCETETLFGTRREEKTMTVAELRAAFAKVGSSRLFNDVMRRFDEGKDANVLLHIPCETWIVKS